MVLARKERTHEPRNESKTSERMKGDAKREEEKHPSKEVLRETKTKIK